MQKNKLYLPQPPLKKKNHMKLPPLLNRRDLSQNQKSFNQDLFDENETEKLLAELLQKS